MIQRIQTLYLLLVVFLGVAHCFLPLVTFSSNALNDDMQIWQLAAFEMKNYEIEQGIMGENIPIKGLSVLGLAAILIPLFAFVDIFLYKYRLKQARLNIFLLTLCLGFYAILGVYIRFVVTKWNMEWSFTVSASIPLICFILTIMAIRLILKDEALVRSYNRLR